MFARAFCAALRHGAAVYLHARALGSARSSSAFPNIASAPQLRLGATTLTRRAAMPTDDFSVPQHRLGATTLTVDFSVPQHRLGTPRSIVGGGALPAANIGVL